MGRLGEQSTSIGGGVQMKIPTIEQVILDGCLTCGYAFREFEDPEIQKTHTYSYGPPMNYFQGPEWVLLIKCARCGRERRAQPLDEAES